MDNAATTSLFIERERIRAGQFERHLIFGSGTIAARNNPYAYRSI